MFNAIKRSVKELCLGAENRAVRLVLDEFLKRRAANRIALIDHRRAHEAIAVPLQTELNKILSFSSEFETELYVRRFEADFAKLCQRRFAVGTHSATSALQLLLPGSVECATRHESFDREPSAWDRYKTYIISGAVLIVVQAGLIAGLLIQAARRKKAEAQLRGVTKYVRN